MNSNLMSLSAKGKQIAFLMQFFSILQGKNFAKKLAGNNFLSNFCGDQYRNTAESYVKNLRG